MDIGGIEQEMSELSELVESMLMYKILVGHKILPVDERSLRCHLERADRFKALVEKISQKLL